MGRYVAEDVATRVVNEHGFDHISKFNNPELGPVLNIYTREELQNHLSDILPSKDIKAATLYSTNNTRSEVDIFYHEPTNTMVINPANPDHAATAYRPDVGPKLFETKLAKAQEIEGREIPVVYGINELNPELQKTPQLGLEPKQLAPSPGGDREDQYQELRDLFESYYGKDDRDYEPEAPSLEQTHEEKIER